MWFGLRRIKNSNPATPRRNPDEERLKTQMYQQNVRVDHGLCHQKEVTVFTKQSQILGSIWWCVTIQQAFRPGGTETYQCLVVVKSGQLDHALRHNSSTTVVLEETEKPPCTVPGDLRVLKTFQECCILHDPNMETGVGRRSGQFVGWL